MTNGWYHDRAIDVSKGIGILLVVYAHTSEVAFFGVNWDHPLFTIWKYIYSFHMPLFFFLSGMLFRLGDDRRAWHGCLQLIAVAQLSNFVAALVEFVALPGRDVTPYAARVVTTLATNANFLLIVTWFLVTIALVRLAHHYFVRGGTKVRILVVSLLALSYLVHLRTGTNGLQMQSLLPAFAFHAAGHLGASLRRSLRRLPAIAVVAVAAVLLVGGLVLAGFNGGCAWSVGGVCADFGSQFVVFMISGRTGFFPVFFVSAVLSSAGVYCAAHALVRLLPLEAEPLGDFGERTVDILLLNGAVLAYLNPLLRQSLLSWGVGIPTGIGLVVVATALQFAFLPVSILITEPLRALADRLAAAIVTARCFVGADEAAGRPAR